MRPKIKKALSTSEIVKLKLQKDAADRNSQLVSEGAAVVKMKDDIRVISEMYQKVDESRAAKNAHTEFQNNVKKVLVVEGISNLVERVLRYERGNTAVNSYVTAFVESTGHVKLMNTFKTTSPLLAHIHSVIESTHAKIVEAADPEKPETQIVDDSDRDTFFDDLDCTELDDAVSEIRTRVQTAVDAFITSNEKDKEEIKELIDAAQANVDGARNEKIAEGVEFKLKRDISMVKTRRNHGVFEHFVTELAKLAVTDEVIKEQFSQDGSLDMEAVFEFSKVPYAMMETVNTLNISKMTISELENTLTQL